MIEQKTFYVTKYALTVGIIAVQGRIADTSPNMLCYITDDWRYTQYAHGKEWHDNLADAIADCERRRKAKLASIEKQRQKLEKLEFKL
ncbi:hypothetical protein [Lonsdalea quercina]|uniref:hypothetical protein n=1 Tax=Lonsdalea quercina TaxID=71657 RepID=UPI00397608CB